MRRGYPPLADEFASRDIVAAGAMNADRGTPARRLEYLQAMGITPWVRRDAGPLMADVTQPDSVDAPMAPRVPQVHAVEPRIQAGSESPPVTRRAAPEAGAGGDARLADLAVQVAACRACVLHESRNNTVFGVGNPNARCLFIGEAPGADEDRQGEPFVGRAGQLLNAMLAAIGLQREDVYIANILKCRPPRNRDPRPEEVACCSGFLRAQIDAIAPRVMVAVGRIAAQHLLGTTQPLGRLRGVLHSHPETGIPLLVTYHPAYLLRTPSDKSKAWQDLRRLRELMGRP